MIHEIPVIMRLNLIEPAGREALPPLGLTDMQFEMSAYRPPAGGLRLPSGKYGGIITDYWAKVK